MSAKEKRVLQAELARQGFVIREIGQWPAKATYYKKNGEAMKNLPADPFSMQKYCARGFTLVPPSAVPEGVREDTSPTEEKAEVIEDTPNQCQICGFIAKNEAGLYTHTVRKHRN